MIKKIIFTGYILLCTTILFSQNIPSYVPKDGLVGWWPFNGNANDESGNGYHGTVYGATLTTDRKGNPNSAYSFNGISDSIQISNSDKFDLGGGLFSISIWFKAKKDPSSIIYKGGNYLYYFLGGIGINPIGNNQQAFANTIFSNIWHHLVCVRNKDGLNYYVDNKKWGTLKIDSTNFLSDISSILVLGKKPNQNKIFLNSFDGSLNKFAIFNRPLTDQEVDQLYKEIPTCFNINPIISSIRKNTFCQGDSTILKTNSYTDSKYYLWYKDGTIIPNAHDSLFVVKQSGNYSVGVSNDSVCESRSAATNVKVYPIPTNSSLNTKDTTLCEGETLTLKTEKKEGYRFQWKKDNIRITNASTENYFVNSPGTYSVVTYSYCNDSIESNLVKINYIIIPSSSIVAEGKTNFCYGDSVKLKLDKKYANALQWFNGSNAILGATDSIYYAKTTGAYSFRLLEGRCFKNSSQQTINVELQEPKLHFNRTLICEGDTTGAFVGENDMSSVYKGVNTYTWFLDNKEIVNSSSNLWGYVLITNKAGVYKVKLTSATCNVFTNEVVIKNLPKIDIQYTTTNGQLIGNSPFSVLFNTNSTSSNLKWDFGDGTTSISKNPIHVFQTNGQRRDTSSYTVLLNTSNNECGSLNVKVLKVKSSENKFLSFEINQPKGKTTFFGKDSSFIGITLPNGTVLTNLIANFTSSPYSTVKVNGVIQMSGKTANDFSDTVKYEVIAEDGSIKIFFVKVIYDKIINEGKFGFGVIDIEGNKYSSVIIGNQEWMGENLRVTKFNDGTQLANLKDSSSWFNKSSIGWCFYNNDSINNQNFGKLYNYNVILSNEKNICPSGWHIPVYNEWNVLTNFLGGEKTAGAKLKDTSSWENNSSSSNSSYFSALPCGFRSNKGGALFLGKGAYAFFWAKNVISQTMTYPISLRSSDNSVGPYWNNEYNGFSIRCIKDSVSIIKPNLCSGFFANLIAENDKSNDTKCTGKLTSNVGGGLQPYTYAWSTGATSAHLTDVCAQTYTLEVTDKNNCKLTVSKAVGVDSVINPCANFKAFISSVEPTGINATTCNGSVSVKADGGTQPYSYAWNNGVKTASITEVCQGEYQVTVTDKNNCSINLSAKVALDSTKNACAGFYTKVFSVKEDNGTCNGEIHTATYGGKLPYAYNWNNGQTDSVLTKACKGVYSLQVSDANKCQFRIEKEVKSSVVIDPCKDFYAVVSELKDVASQTACNGKIVVQAKGGKSPYTYAWVSGDTSSILENKCAGSYSATITDANNCKVTVSTSISKIQAQAVKLEAEITTKDATSAQACDGGMSIKVTNGTAPYTYSHSNGETNNQRTALCSGVYTVTIKDVKGNEQTLNYVISNPVNTIQTIVSTLKDSISIDTLKTKLQNECSIAYDAIDSVKIKEIVVVSKDSVLVTWSVYAKDKQTFVSQKYLVNKGEGVYTLALSMYCKELKGIGSYFTASQKAYLKVGGNNTTSGITTLENAATMRVYPNPFTDKVEISTSEVSDYQIELMDVTGKRVYHQEFKQTKQMSIDFGELSTGEYLLKVTNKDDVQIRKISRLN